MNPTLCRDVNSRIYSLTRSFDGPGEYVCECGHVTCRGIMIAVLPDEFAVILALPGALLVAPGHETPGTEIVRQGRGYLVVRPAAQTASPASRTRATR